LFGYYREKLFTGVLFERLQMRQPVNTEMNILIQLHLKWYWTDWKKKNNMFFKYLKLKIEIEKLKAEIYILKEVNKTQTEQNKNAWKIITDLIRHR